MKDQLLAQSSQHREKQRSARQHVQRDPFTGTPPPARASPAVEPRAAQSRVTHSLPLLCHPDWDEEDSDPTHSIGMCTTTSSGPMGSNGPYEMDTPEGDCVS